MEQRIRIDCDDHLIPGVYIPGSPAVLLLHGFLSWKDGDGFLLEKTAHRLAAAGYGSLRIDFCSMGENRHTRKAYGQAMLLREAECACAWLKARTDGPVFVLGHSLGGRTAMLAKTDCAGTIVLNGMTDLSVPFGLVNEETFACKDHGLVQTSDGRTELLFPAFLEQDRNTLSREQTDVPLLAVMATGDGTVPYAGQRQAFDALQGPKTLLELPGGDHTFLAKASDDTMLDVMLPEIIKWMSNLV